MRVAFLGLGSMGSGMASRLIVAGHSLAVYNRSPARALPVIFTPSRANDISGEELYQPAAYRGTLQKVDQAFGPVADWPWSDIEPSDFASGVNEFLMLRGLTPADVAALGIPDIQGGMSGLNLKSADKLFSLAIRPLLPDENK